MCGLGQSFVFIILMMSFATSWAQASDERSCQNYLSNRQLVVREHPYFDFQKSRFETYDEFSQALTEGMRVHAHQFSMVEKYFREYFGLGIGYNIDFNSKEFKKKIQAATDVKNTHKTMLGEVSFKLNKKNTNTSSNLSSDEQRRHEWAIESEYLRLRPLSPMEVPFVDYTRGFNQLYSRYFERRFFDSVDEHFYFTLTNEKNQSLGQILIGIVSHTETDEFGTATMKVASLHHVSGIPVVALDQVFLALYKIFSAENLSIIIHQDFEDPRAYIDIPVNEHYDPPLMFDDTDLEIASDPNKPEAIEEYIAIDKVKVVDRSQRYHKTRHLWMRANLDELFIHSKILNQLYGAETFDEIVKETENLFEQCKGRAVDYVVCKKILEATLYDSDLDFNSKFELLKTYIRVQALDYPSYVATDLDLSLFQEYWPLIFAFDDEERSIAISKLLKIYFDEPKTDMFMKVLTHKLIYGMHSNFDVETLDFIFGESNAVISDTDRLPLVNHPPGEALETSYAVKIRANDLGFIERLLQNGLEPTRGLTIAMAQKFIHPNFNLTVEMVELFVEYGANVNYEVNRSMYFHGAKGWFHLTPGESFLSTAILLGREDLVAFFVENDSSLFENIVLKDKTVFQFKTISLIEYAERLGFFDIAEYLKDQTYSIEP